MVCYRRDDKSSRPNSHKKYRRYLSGSGPGRLSHDTTYTLVHHGGILPSPASSAPAPAPRIRFGAPHNPGENTLARQPGTFRNGN